MSAVAGVLHVRRHSATGGAIMIYQINGTLIRQDVLRLPHEEYVQLMASKMVPSLRILITETPGTRLLAGGMPAGGRNLVMIVDLQGDSHRVVRHFLASLPLFEYYEWQTTPLESFEEMARAFGVS
jgi:hypothetical protein